MMQCQEELGKQIEQISPALNYNKTQKGYNFIWLPVYTIYTPRTGCTRLTI